jgi:diguanylate cyclase (GGDEF)-like protein
MTTPAPVQPHGRFRLSLATRLGLGFGLIAMVLLLGHDAALRDMRDAIDTLRETQTEQVPLSRLADALTYHVVAFDRAVLTEVRAPTEANGANVTEAEQALFGSLDSYENLQPGSSAEIAGLRAEAKEHTNLGSSLIQAGAERRLALNGIRDSLDQLTLRISKAFSLNVQLPDPAFARRAYAELELDLGRLRGAFNDYLISGSKESDKAMRTATRGFRTTLTQYREELQRSPGRSWVELVEEDIGRAERLRQKVVGLDASIETLRGRFTASGMQLPLRLEISLAAPASQAVAESAESAVDATLSAEVAIRRLTYLILAVTLLVSGLTMLAVIRPVRRLTSATRALTQGGHHVRVPPGGSLELDELGQAFNQMAERLAEADEESLRHQLELEDRVRTRTQKLYHLANHDPLSGLPNRRYAFNHLRRAADVAKAKGGGLGLIALDIDNFKVINDTFGHDVGDALLRGVTERLRLLVGKFRFVARLGGDEFVVSLLDTKPAEATEAMAERIVNGFRAPLNLGGREILVSVSVGVAHLPEHAGDAADLVRAADAALFRAKALGRNRIAIFSQALLEDSESRFAVEQSLHRAVDAGELALVYQPQISLFDGTTEVVEALLRWQRADGAMIPAREFIAIAEQSGLIIEIGEWVLETAAAAVADWRARGFEDARVAINVSVHQLLDNRFVERLTEVLKRFRLPGSAIELELTETTFQTSSATVRALSQLREGGVGLALDDFGTGYSSLTSLSRLPLRRVKIDRSLVVDAPASPRAESLARSIIGVCHNLGLGVTVEGIERPDQLVWLAGCGPVCAQGMLIAQPMTSINVPDFARHSPQHLKSLLDGDRPLSDRRRTGDAVIPFRKGSDSADR